MAPSHGKNADDDGFEAWVLPKTRPRKSKGQHRSSGKDIRSRNVKTGKDMISAGPLGGASRKKTTTSARKEDPEDRREIQKTRKSISEGTIIITEKEYRLLLNNNKNSKASKSRESDIDGDDNGMAYSKS